MIEPITRTKLLDCRDHLLLELWLKKKEPQHPRPEQLGEGLWQTGGDGAFKEEILSAISQSREVICASSFIWSDEELTDALVQAAARGVRVYLLTGSAGQIKKWLDQERSLDNGRLESHTQLLDRMAGYVLVRSADLFHAKFLLADPIGSKLNSSEPGPAFLSTANLNPALTKSVDLGIRLVREDADALFNIFQRAFWELATYELFEPGEMTAITEIPEIPLDLERATGSLRCTFGNRATLKLPILDLIQKSKDYLIVSTYTVRADHETVKSIADAAIRGVDVKVMMRRLPANAEAALLLAKAGARVRAHDSLHAKAVISDGNAIVMTANLTPLGMDSGFEVGSVLDATRTELLRKTLSGWFETFPWEFSYKSSVGDHLGEACSPADWNGDLPLLIEEQKSIHLQEPIAAVSVLLMEETEPENIEEFARESLAHYVELNWQVAAPHLPNGATELKRISFREESYRRPVFEKDGDYFVLGDSKDKRAKRIAKKFKAGLVEERPEGATEIYERIGEEASYSPRLFELNGQKYVQLSATTELEDARKLAGEQQAFVVI